MTTPDTPSNLDSVSSKQLWPANITAYLLIAFVLFCFTCYRGYKGLLEPKLAASATADLVSAVSRRDVHAAGQALNGMARYNSAGFPTIAGDAAKAVLSNAQMAKLQGMEAPYSLLAIALAGGDLPSAELLLQRGHFFYEDERYLLASALAGADSSALPAWRNLMAQLSRYRGDMLHLLDKRDRPVTVERAWQAATLRGQREFPPWFTQGDADEAFYRCDTATLRFLLAQDATKEWKFSLEPVLVRLAAVDLQAMQAENQLRGPMTTGEPVACLETARLLLNQSTAQMPYPREMSFAGPLHTLDASQWSKVLQSVQAATTDRMRLVLEPVGLRVPGEGDDVPDRVLAYLDTEKPPYYPYAIQLQIMLLEKLPHPDFIQVLLYDPTAYHYHRAVREGVREALQTWHVANPSEAYRPSLLEMLNGNFFAVVYEGKGAQAQVATIKSWLQAAGLPCRPAIHPTKRGFGDSRILLTHC